MFFHVVIVGAGLAGSFIAYRLACHGISSCMIGYPPQEKPCGGATSLDTLTQFCPELKVPLERQFVRINQLRFSELLQGEEVWKEPRQRNLGVFARRVLDGYIHNSALERGAQSIPEYVINFQQISEGWSIQTKQGTTVPAKILIGADGAKSGLVGVRSRLVGKLSRAQYSLTVGYFGRGVSLDYMHFAFTPELEGYIWVFPRQDHLSIGLIDKCHYHVSGSQLFQILDRFLARYYPNVKCMKRWAAFIPTVPKPEFYSHPCCGENWALIGDAACHTDAVTGEGIDFALRSAFYAAEAIAEGDLIRYETLWRKDYGEALIQSSRIAQTYKELSHYQARLTILKKVFGVI